MPGEEAAAAAEAGGLCLEVCSALPSLCTERVQVWVAAALGSCPGSYLLVLAEPLFFIPDLGSLHCSVSPAEMLRSEEGVRMTVLGPRPVLSQLSQNVTGGRREVLPMDA